MTQFVEQLESKGRSGDTILAHINPEEAQLLKDHGGSGTINPETGIMEFGVFSDLWSGFKKVVKSIAPVIIPAIAIFVPTLIPAIGTALGASAATAGIVGAAALSAGVTLAAGGSLKDVLTSAALAGASTYLTPMLGKALTTAGASQLTQIMAGSAAFGAGYTALRGGSVKEMLAAATTGAASAYLGNVAAGAVAKMNNMMASGTSNTISQKGATDAVFAGADAANLKAAGLSENQIAQTLKATGMDALTAEYAAQMAARGDAADTIAANLAANKPTGIYTGEANSKSITAGNNAAAVQRVEDANFVAADAAQLKAQGLSQAQIVENLVASGVDKNVANYVAGYANQGLNETQLADKLVNSTNFMQSGKVFTGTETINRDLGQAMTADQQKAFDALPYKDQVNKGILTVDEASVLGQQGVTTKQFDDLVKLGYTANDISDLIGAGTDVTTLTNLANTKFPEATINDLLMKGISANDIAGASGAMNAFSSLSVEEATQLLSQGKSGSSILSLAANNQLPSQVPVAGPAQPVQTLDQQIASTGLVDSVDAKILANAGYSVNDVKNLINTGYQAADLADLASAGVPASTLTTLATTPIPEATINNLLMTGTSANDIAGASSFIKSGQLSVDQATNLLGRDIPYNDIRTAAVTGTANTLIKGLDAGLSPTAINKLQGSGVNVDNLLSYIDKGLIDSAEVNSKAAGTGYASWANNQITSAQQIEIQNQKAQLALEQAQEQALQAQNPSYNQAPRTSIGNGLYELTGSGLIVDGNNNYVAENYQDYLAKTQSTQPSIPSTAIQTVDSNGNVRYFDTATGQTLDSSGQVVAQPIQPSSPISQTAAAYTPQQEARYNELIKQGMSPAQATSMIDTGSTVSDTIQVTGSAGLLGNERAVVNEYRTPNTDLATQQQVDSGAAKYNIAANAWEVPTAATTVGAGAISPDNIDVGGGFNPATGGVSAPAPVVPNFTQQATNFASSHGLKTTQIPQVEQALQNGYTEKQLDTAFRQNPYGNWLNSFTQTTVAPVVQPTVQPTAPVAPPVAEIPEVVVTAPKPEPVVTPPVVLPPTPIIPTTPVAPQPVTVVSSSTRTTSDGSVYRDDQKSDGTVTSVLISGPTTTGPTTDIPEIVVTAPKEPPLTPPVQVTIPPDNSIPTNVDPGGSYEGDIVTPVEPPITPPYIPVPTPITPPEPLPPETRGRYTWGTVKPVERQTELNPGLINPPVFYQNTNPAQAKYYWGQRPFQPTSTFDPVLYNQIPNAPVVPWGATQAARAATSQEILAKMGQYYPLMNTPVAGPVRP